LKEATMMNRIDKLHEVFIADDLVLFIEMLICPAWLRHP